ncbi:MAG: hypothetical protein ABR543_11360 [Gemmatimonadaceae bacterium]
MLFKLRFPEEKISFWAERFSYPNEDRVETEIAPIARDRGYLTWPEFVEMCKWKTPRSQPLVKSNAPDIVRAVTRASLDSPHDDVKIGVLRALRGVSWPTASVILHFCDRKPYPILDVRALWSLGYTRRPNYTLEFWLEYTKFTCDLALRTGHSMRAVDRALWQYSSERQRS